MELESFRKALFTMLWKRPPNGSGISLTRADLMDMEWAEIRQWQKFLGEAWDAESGGMRPEK